MIPVYVPKTPHSCASELSKLELPYPYGTVMRCDCDRFWVADRHPSVRDGQQQAGVRWRPEKRRERRHRERADREARMAPPPSFPRLEAPPTAAALATTAKRPSGVVLLACRHLDPEEGVMRSGHVVTGDDEAALRTVLRFVSAAAR